MQDKQGITISTTVTAESPADPLVLDKQLSYWRQQLGHAPALLELPTDRPRQPMQSFRGARQPLVLSDRLSGSLKALSQREGVTLFMILLAAFQTLLYRYTGQEDIVVGSPIANRNRAEVEGLIGLFVNTLALRTDLSGNPTFRELLERVKEAALGAFAHRDVPFEKLIEELQRERDLSQTPLFQVVFSLQDTPVSALDFPGQTIIPMDVDSGKMIFDLALHLKEMPRGLSGFLEYNSDLFDASTISRTLGHLEALLEGIVADPNQRLSELPLLTEAERHQLLVQWNDTKTDYPKDYCLHKLFEAQVGRTPDAVAVVFEDEQLTYSELNRRANQLAHYLRERGVGPEVRVGLCMERSLEMVVGLLGILKAGGAYVPLDPAYPQERLGFMLEDADVPVLVTQERLLESLPAHRAEEVSFDADRQKIARESEENPASGATADNLAYVIYTSGSTGKPKGVQIKHHSVVNLFEATRPMLGFNEHDIWTVCHSFGFDLSVWEIWGAILHGGRLIVVPLRVTQSPAQLYDLLHSERVTILSQTPSAMHLLMQAQLRTARAAGNLSLRAVICGGEALPLEVASQLLGWNVSIWNFYGPTEATVWTTVHHINSTDTKKEMVSIGRPIANSQAYLLDSHLQPVPVGVPGELHIGGDGLARGYLNRPELTAEKFIPNPFGSEPGARLYKTGDLARYLPDGNIEFLGRMDHQVKVRGFRIELGEIEAVLGQHVAVRENLVAVREDIPGDKRLVGYVVAAQEPTPTVSELYNYLKQKLPEYMVPAAFVILDELPLTPNGKVDRRALPAPGSARPELEETFVAPRNPIEEVLAGIWAEVLSVKRVGTYDDFFELGGTSLLAVRLFAQIEKVFGENLPLATLFQAPTIAQLAEILRREEASASWSSLVPIQPDGSKPPFFCIHGAGANVLVFRNLSHRLGEDQPFYGLQAQGLDGKHAPHTSVEEMAAHYIKEIRSVQPEGPYYLGGFSMGGVVAFEMAQQLHAQGHKVALLALMDTFLKHRPKYFPDRTHASVHRVVARIGYHLNELIRVGYKKYVLKRKRYIKARMKRRLREISHNFYPALPGMESHVSLVISQTKQALLQTEKEYVPRLYPGRITLFWGSEVFLRPHHDWRLGWSELAADGMEVYVVPGDHVSMREEPHVTVLAEKLKACIDRARVTEPSNQTETWAKAEVRRQSSAPRWRVEPVRAPPP